MKLRFTVHTPTTPSAPCNGALSVTTYTNTLLTINNGLLGNVISSVALSTFGAIPPFIMVDNNGNNLACTGTLVGNVVMLHIPLVNIWDNVTFTLTLVDNTGVLNTYSKTFTIFGYDLGNDIPSGITTNQDFDIVLINVAQNLPYSGVIAYRKPFTTKVYYYSNNSSPYTSLGLYDGSNNLLSDMSFGTLCESSDIELYYITQTGLGICSQTVYVDVPLIQWTPTFTITTDCVNNCSPECITTLASNTATIAVDYTTLGLVNINDVTTYPYLSQGFSFYLYDSTGTLVTSEHFVNNIKYGTTASAYTWTTGTFAIPTVGDFVIKGCIEVLGYEPQGIFATNPTLVNGEYYGIKNIELTASFAACSTPVNPGTVDTMFASNGSSPASWSILGKLIPGIVTGNPIAGKYYKLAEYTNSADFTNLITTDTGSVAVKQIFYSDGTAPNSWGAGLINAYAPLNYGAALVETLPIITCCQVITGTGCLPYELVQSACNDYILSNRSLCTISYEIYIFDDTNYTSILTGTVASLTDDNITFASDGIYRIDITDCFGNVESFIEIITCAIEACKLMHLQNTICSNPEGNCGKCSNCGTKDYYNFNAFSVIMQNYFMLVNAQLNFVYPYSITDITSSTMIANLSTINDLLTKALEYCEVCNEPCTNCHDHKEPRNPRMSMTHYVDPNNWIYMTKFYHKYFRRNKHN